MKKLTIIIGNGYPGIAFYAGILAELKPNTLMIENESSQDVLQMAKEATSEGKHLLLYTGDKTELLPFNIPCDSIDLGVLVEKLKQVVLATNDANNKVMKPQQHEIMTALLLGGIRELILAK